MLDPPYVLRSVLRLHSRPQFPSGGHALCAGKRPSHNEQEVRMASEEFPKHKVLSWPAVPIPTPDEVYKGLTDQAKEYPLSLEAQLRQSENFQKPECLTKIRVLDVSRGMIIGNWCSSMLSELGADTIKAEPPDGDPLRWQTPFGRKEYMFKDAETGEPIGLHFLHEMRNKQSITLNLEKPEGRELLKKLVVHCDVLIENYP